MATFSDYVNVEAEIEVSAEDIYDAMSERELKQFIRILEEEGHIRVESIKKNGIPGEMEWEKVVDKLASGRVYLTLEEEELIKKLTERIP
jgi:hypothetical protein